MFKQKHKVVAKKMEGMMTAQEFKEYKCKYHHPDPQPITEYPVIVEAWAKEKKKYSRNIILSKHLTRPEDSKPVKSSHQKLIGNGNMLVIGGSGTGKTRSVILPNILQMNGSYVINDSTGDLLFTTGRLLKKHGYDIKVLDFTDAEHSNHYNPLYYIRTEQEVDLLIETIIFNTSMEHKSENDFWEQSERKLLSAVINYVVEGYTVGRTFSDVIDMLSLENPQDASKFNDIFKDLPEESSARKCFTEFNTIAQSTRHSIFISALCRLQIFIAPHINKITSSDDIEINSINEKKTAIFVIQGQDPTSSVITTMLYSQIRMNIYQKCEKNRKENDLAKYNPIPVFFMMDDLCHYCSMIPIELHHLSIVRMYGIHVLLTIDSISQLQKLYPDDWRYIIGNCSNIIYLGSYEINTIDFISKLTGQVVKKRKKNNHDEYVSLNILSTEQLCRLPEDMCIVYMQNFKPLLDQKYNLKEHPYYAQTADDDKNNAFNYKTELKEDQ